MIMQLKSKQIIKGMNDYNIVQNARGQSSNSSTGVMYICNDKAVTTATKGVTPLAPNIASCML